MNIATAIRNYIQEEMIQKINKRIVSGATDYVIATTGYRLSAHEVSILLTWAINERKQKGGTK